MLFRSTLVYKYFADKDEIYLECLRAARDELSNPRVLTDRIAVGRALWRELVIGFAAVCLVLVEAHRVTGGTETTFGAALPVLAVIGGAVNSGLLVLIRRGAVSRTAATTCAPLVAKTLAAARPIPLEAPVMTTVRSVGEIDIFVTRLLRRSERLVDGNIARTQRIPQRLHLRAIEALELPTQRGDIRRSSTRKVFVLERIGSEIVQPCLLGAVGNLHLQITVVDREISVGTPVQGSMRPALRFTTQKRQ